MVFPKISDPKPSTDSTYGGLEMSKIQDFLSGFDIGAADDTNRPSINTDTRFKSGKLLLFGEGVNSTNIARFKYPENALATVPEAVVSLPKNLSGSQNNEFVFKDVAQTLTGKEIDASLNALTHISNVNIDSGAAISWSKISKTGSQLGDIANIDLTGRINHSSIYWDAVNAKWVIFQPSNGLDVYLANLNDIILNTPTAGQLLEYNGTMWHNIDSPQISSISKGVYTASGNGTQTVFTIAHGVTDATPNVAFVEPRSTDAIGNHKVTVDATNITVTYTTAPPSGSSNVVLSWMCSDPFGSANNGIDVSKIVKYNQANTYGAFDQIFPSTNLKINDSGFNASLAVNTLASNVIHTFPNSSQNIVGDTLTQTLTNKRIDSLANSGGTVTLPSGPTTLLGHNTTNTISNKTINISDSNIITGLTDSSIATGAALAWSKVSKASSSIGDFGDTIIATPTLNQIIAYDGTKWTNQSVSVLSGETNTVSNIGTAGVGIYKQKTGVNFELKKINAGSTKVTITDDTANNEVDIDLTTANILLQNLGGTATWSQVSKTGAVLADLGGTVSASQIASDAVTTVKILDANVTTAKILDANVTANKLASDAVTTVKILDANVTNAKLATDAVTTIKITDANVTLAKMASNSVDSSKIVDGSIVNADVSSSAAIDWSKVSKTGSVISDIANVVLTSPSTNQVIGYNGTNWVNQTPSSSGGGGANPYTGPKVGKVIPGGVSGAAGAVVGTDLCNGWKTAALTSGNITNGIDADGAYFALNTTATSQTNAEINSVLTTIFRTDLNPKVWLKIKFTASVVNTRSFIGFTDLIALPQNSSTFIQNQNGFGWNYDTSALTNVQLTSNNANATVNLVDTAFVPTLNTALTLKMEYISSTNTVSMSINGGTAITTTTKVPASSATLGFVCREQNTSSSIRTMNVYYLYFEIDR